MRQTWHVVLAGRGAMPASSVLGHASAVMDDSASDRALGRLRLVSARSDAEVAAEEARRELYETLRSFAANLLRIMRGAGKPDQVAGQCVDLLDALERHRAAQGRMPDAAELIDALALPRRRLFRRTLPRDMRRIFDAEQKLLRGALQVAASQLLGQSAQEATGESEVREGARESLEGRAVLDPKVRWEPLARLAKKPESNG